jgi:hypothetical protein
VSRSTIYREGSYVSAASAVGSAGCQGARCRPVADQAVGAVAADQVAGAQPGRSVGAADLGGDRLLVLGEADELVAAADSNRGAPTR